MSSNDSTPSVAVTAQERMAETGTAKVLTFQMAEEHYGVDIQQVQEIIGLLPITRVPNLPHALRGVINLRGRVVPVVDLRVRLGLPAHDDTERTCIIVVRLEGGEGTRVFGLIVDEVREVLDIAAEQIEDPPSLSGERADGLICGLGKLDECVTILLDIRGVLSGAGLAAVEATHEGVGTT